MSAFEQLSKTGQLDQAGGTMLYRVVRAVAVGRGYPPPDGYERWDTDAVVEIAHDFLIDSRAPSRMAHLVTHADDDRSMEALLNRMVLNFLRDRARKTETGRLIRRLNDLMAADEQFVRLSDGRWAAVAGTQTPSAVSFEDLTRAAARVPNVTAPRWRDSASRTGSDSASLTALSAAVLAAAEGSLTTAEIARAVAGRVGLTPTPLALDLETREPAEMTHTTTVELRATESEARAVFDSLGELEKKVLATMQLNVRDLLDVVGLRKSQAAAVRARTIGIVQVQTGHLADPTGVRLHLLDIAQQWFRDRTREHDSPS